MSQKFGLTWIVHFLLIFTIFIIPLVATHQFVIPYVGEKTLTFYLLTEVMVALWLFKFLRGGVYLPIQHPILLAGGIFLFIFTLAGVLGASPEVSFWSSQGRMSGLILLYHIAAFYLVLVSLVRDEDTWKKIFSAVAFSGVIVALGSYGDLNSSIGNSSYVGAYLIFAFFFALMLFFKSASAAGKWLYSLVALVIISCPVFFNIAGVGNLFNDPTSLLGEARAASIGVFAGLLIAGLFYLVGSVLKPKVAWGVRVMLGAILFVVLSGSALVFFTDSLAQQALEEEGIGSRLLFWESAKEGIKERPLLGYGPENYSVPFHQFFEPALLTEQYANGAEAATDKPHNMYLEIAVTGGILSLLAYLVLFLTAFYLLIRARRERLLPLSDTALLFGLLVAYLLQNLLFFDTLTSYIGLAIVLAYITFATSTQDQTIEKHVTLPKLAVWPSIGIVALLFTASLYYLVVSPYNQQTLLMEAMEQMTVTERSAVYEDLFAMSPNGRTSILVYVSNKMLGAVPSAIASTNSTRREMLLQDIRSLRIEIKKYVGEEPIHYRLVLAFVRLHFLELILETDPAKRTALLEEVSKYEPYLEKLSPNNPQNYWVRAQRELFEGNPEEALSTLKESEQLTPNIPATTEMLTQTQSHLNQKTLLPFFLY